MTLGKGQGSGEGAEEEEVEELSRQGDLRPVVKSLLDIPVVLEDNVTHQARYHYQDQNSVQVQHILHCKKTAWQPDISV